MDCPEDVATYIHRVGRTARYRSGGRAVLVLMPSEMMMLEKLQEKKIPVQFIKAECLNFDSFISYHSYQFGAQSSCDVSSHKRYLVN